MKYEAVLKAAGLVAALVLLANAPAGADTLVTGAIRDRAGVPVPGAGITALDAAGAAVGHDVAAADGTFALATPAAPAVLVIACDYCETMRRPVIPGEPFVVIITRYGALLSAGPSPADIRALPYRGAGDIASLVPFTIAGDGRIADRGLDRVAAIAVNGLPFYNPADGSTAAALVPAHAIAALAIAQPFVAPVVGGYAAAGIYDLRLRDPDLATSRFDFGTPSDVVARLRVPSFGAGYATSTDANDDRESLSLNADASFGGGRLAFEALDVADAATHASGAGLSYQTDSRRYTTAAAMSVTQTGASTLDAFAARIHNRGPFGLELGVRATRASTQIATSAAVQNDAAVYAGGGWEGSAGSIAATLAWDRGGDAAGASAQNALVGSLTDDLRLSSRWGVHLGTVSNARVPTFAEAYPPLPSAPAADRTSLVQESLTYTDLRRLQLAILTYTQRTTGPAAARIDGAGINAVWQISPDFTLRSWLLDGRRSTAPSASSAAPYFVGVAQTTRQAHGLVWFTYEKAIRIDALIRGGSVEGDVRIPIGAIYGLTLGTATYQGRRSTTFGITRR